MNPIDPLFDLEAAERTESGLRASATLLVFVIAAIALAISPAVIIAVWRCLL